MELVENHINSVIYRYPKEWKISSILINSTLKARIGWQGLTTAEYLKTGNFLLITGTDFINGRINWETCHYVVEERYIQDRNIQLKKNDILVTKDGTIGKVAFIDDIYMPSTLNSGIFVLRPKKEAYYPLFLFYVLKSFIFENFLNQLVAGSTIKHLYQKDFVNFKFPLPNKKEQKAISLTLSDTDNLIRNIEKIISKKKNIKHGTIQKLLTPSTDWKKNRLGEIGHFYKGKGLPKSQISESGKYKCIHYGELFTKHEECINEIISYTDDNSNSFFSVSNDVLMPTSDVTPNGLATASCIFEDNVILGGDILVIRVAKEILNGLYLSYFIKNNKDKVMKLVSGSTVYHLYGSDMKELEITYPNIHIQNQIAKVLLDMDIEIKKLETKLEKLKKIKLGMLQNLLTGKIRLV